MSYKAKTLTPFVDKKILLEAMDNLNISYREANNNIIIQNILDYQGQQYFTLNNMRYQYVHDSNSNVNKFLAEIEKEYKSIHNKLIKKIMELEKRKEEERIKKELERLRKEQEEMERKRVELIENNKKMIKEKAKKMGYKVKETVKDGKVKMVLVRRTY